MASPGPIATGATVDFHARNPTSEIFSTGLISLGVGTFVASIQNSLAPHNEGARGVVTRYGGTIGLFTAMGVGFIAVDSTLANLREKDDAWNGVAGGCAAGFLAGIKNRSLPQAFGACAIIGTAIGTFDAAGKSLGSNRGRMNRAEREEARLAHFKKRSLADSVNTAQLERRGIAVD